jgi:hypothetical protein
MMGLYLFNISVDIADPEPQHIPEDLSFNDQESFVELILEKVLGYEDAIKEVDDHDAEDYNKLKNTQVDLTSQEVSALNFKQFISFQQETIYPHYQAGLTQGFGKIDSPPPKA